MKMNNQEKIELYNKISVMSLEDAVKFAVQLLKDGNTEQGNYVQADNLKRSKRAEDLKSGRW